jgi:hypothetical protein
VLAIAINSGLVAYPTAYTKVWAGRGGAVWRAVPPPGYVAAGDLFSEDGEEPQLSDMVCLHGGWRCRDRADQVSELTLGWPAAAAWRLRRVQLKRTATMECCISNTRPSLTVVSKQC